MKWVEQNMTAKYLFLKYTAINPEMHVIIVINAPINVKTAISSTPNDTQVRMKNSNNSVNPIMIIV